jgi:hypothetical protein
MAHGKHIVLQRPRHRARLRIRIGRHIAMHADVAIGSSGLWAIGGLVSSILLSSAAIVAATRIAPRS